MLNSPSQVSLFVLHLFLRCGERDFMDAIIRKAIVAKDINHKGQGLWVTMRKLLGDFAQVN